MALDALIANPGRLRILVSLAAEPSQEFVRLRERTRLTDGNLSTHAKRLHNGGLVAIDKSFRAGKPVTTVTLTGQGRRALEDHVRGLTEALNIPAAAEEKSVSLVESSQSDDWID